MHKAVHYPECLHGLSSDGPERLRHLLGHVIGEVQLLVYNVHDAWRPYCHRLEQGVALAVDYGIVRTDVSGYELLDDIVSVRICIAERLQFFLIVNLVRAAGPHAYIRLCNDRVAAESAEPDYLRQPSLHFNLSCGRDAVLQIDSLHLGLFLDEGNAVCHYSRDDIEVGPEPGILFEPVFIVRLYPVDFPVFVRQEGYSLEHLLIIFHIVNPVILCKSLLEIGVQGFVWRICDSQYVDPVALEPAAEFPVSMGKLRGDKDEIQHC